MPTKKKKTAKKATKSTSKKTTLASKSSTKTSAPKKEEHPLHKKHLHNEQEEFFAKNPNAKPLILIFILLSVAAFLYIIQVQGLLTPVSY